MNWPNTNTANIGYYRVEGSICNEEDLTQRLLVNCCGVTVISKPFRTFNPQGRHDFYLMLLLEGALDAVADDTSLHLSSSDAVIYPPDRAYGYQLTEPERMVYLWVHFTGYAVPALLQNCRLDTARIYHLNDSKEAQQDFEAIQRLFLSRPPFFLEESSIRLELLFTHIARALNTPEQPRPADRLQTSLRYLNLHYAETLHLEELAGMEFLSPSRYSALFRRATGLSPQQYLIRLRLKAAQELLSNTDLSVAEVARSVGYDDALYFSRLYHRHMGQTPSSAHKRPRDGR